HTRSKRDWSSDVCSSDLKTRIQVPLWLDIILFFSDRVSRFRHSLSNSSHISDSISRFPHSLSDSSHISDRISRFRHSLSDSSLISDRFSRSPHSMSDSSHISDKTQRSSHSLSDSSSISQKLPRLLVQTAPKTSPLIQCSHQKIPASHKGNRRCKISLTYL